jgi:hypothetical protein
MSALEWTLIVAVAYAGLMFVLFAGLRVAKAADDAADRALIQLLRQRRTVPAVGASPLPDRELVTRGRAARPRSRGFANLSLAD